MRPGFLPKDSLGATEVGTAIVLIAFAVIIEMMHPPFLPDSNYTGYALAVVGIAVAVLYGFHQRKIGHQILSDIKVIRGGVGEIQRQQSTEFPQVRAGLREISGQTATLPDIRSDLGALKGQQSEILQSLKAAAATKNREQDFGRLLSERQAGATVIALLRSQGADPGGASTETRAEDIDDFSRRIKTATSTVRIWRGGFSSVPELAGAIKTFLSKNDSSLRILVAVNQWSWRFVDQLLTIQQTHGNLELRHFDTELRAELYDGTLFRVLLKTPKTAAVVDPVSAPTTDDEFWYKSWVFSDAASLSWAVGLWNYCWDQGTTDVAGLVTHWKEFTQP